MTDSSRVFPTAAEIEANTPPERDRAIDVIRIAALVGVVVGHTIMATNIVTDGVRPLENAPLPLWAGGCVALAGVRSTAVGVLLCIAVPAAPPVTAPALT